MGLTGIRHAVAHDEPGLGMQHDVAEGRKTAMKVVAHRGNVPGFKELTRATFEKAFELPIHGVELDVRLCKTGEVVVYHDRRLGQFGEHGPVSSTSLDDILKLNIGTEDNPQQILTLDQFLDLYKELGGDKHIYIETKHPTRYGVMLEEQVLRSLMYTGLSESEKVHIISFSHACMHRMARLAPQLDRIYLRRQWELRYNPGDILLSRPNGLGISVGMAHLNEDLIGAYGLTTYLWTANNAEDLTYAKQKGVDIVATDKPELAQAIADGKTMATTSVD